MAKITVEGQVYEGTPEELKEIFEMFGVKFPTEEVAKVEAPKFSVGDYVKVMKDIYEYKQGDIVKITSEENDPHSSFDFRVLSLSQGRHGYVSVNWIEKVSEEEAVRFEKWAKIGRKPNEFKKGDIVRVKPNNYWFDNSDYIYGVVDHLAESGNPSVIGRVKDGRIISLYIEVDNVELIAPAESRFDEAK
jgi:ribosomal protein L21E